MNPPSSRAALLRERSRGARRGASLIMVLVILAALTGVVTVFARMARNEMRISRGYSNVLRADLAARAGAAEAEGVLVNLFHDHPDSVTYWDTQIGASPNTPGTVFLYRDLPPDKEYPGTAATPPKVFARPLVSGATEQQFYPANNYALALTADQVASTNSIDINSNQTADLTSPFNGDPHGWVGLPASDAEGQPQRDGSGNTTPAVIRVPWVEVLKDPSQAKDLPVVRYAWWIEDESFKLNVNTAKAAPRGDIVGETDTTTKIVTPQPSLQGLFAPGGGDTATVAAAVESLRASLKATGGKFLSAFQIGHVNASSVPADTTAATFGRDYHFYLTTVSSGLNLSRTGAKRLNVNTLVDASNKAGPTAASIRIALNQIIAAVKQQAPHFGERFYRLAQTLTQPSLVKGLPGATKNLLQVLPTTNTDYGPAPLSGALTTHHRELYLTKIAANVYDYISPNANPTVVSAVDGTVLYGQVPDTYTKVFPENAVATSTAAKPNDNLLAAVGKKAIPYFQEYVLHAKILADSNSGGLPMPTGSAPDPVKMTGFDSTIEVEMDHYFGFWNMTGKDIDPNSASNNGDGDLGPSPFLAVQDMPILSCDSDPDPFGGNYQSTAAKPYPNIPADGLLAERDFEIHLKDSFTNASGAPVKLVFKAGQFTVITTDPNFAVNGVHLWTDNKMPTANIYAATALYHKTPAGGQVASSVGFEVGTDPATNVRHFIAKTDRTDNNLFRIDMTGRNLTASTKGNIDSQTKVLLGNQNGVFDGCPALWIQRSDNTSKGVLSINEDDNGKSNPTLDFFRGSYLGGASLKTSLSALINGGADPRGNLESLKWNYQGQVSDGSPALGSALTNNNMGNQQGNSANAGQVKENSNLGGFAATQDPSSTGGTWWESDRQPKGTANVALNAPMVIAGAPMKSIGELGNVFDPIRFGLNTLASGPLYFWRPGGSTLPVGQPDILWDGYGIARSGTAASSEMGFQTSRSRTWLAWRLCDIFSVGDDTTTTGTVPTRKEDGFTQKGLEFDGLYNPNGILRDQGRSFRALLEGIQFTADTATADATLTGKTLQTATLSPTTSGGALLPLSKRGSFAGLAAGDLGTGGQALANFLAIRLTRQDVSGNAAPTFSPVWERGELSQLSPGTLPFVTDPGSGPASATTTVGVSTLLDAGTKTSAVSDRGREELFRRLAELVTTRGNTFSIYVVGQVMDRSGTTVIATKARRFLVRLHPAFSPEIDDVNHPFNPLTASDITSRFRPPDSWKVEVLGIDEG